MPTNNDIKDFIISKISSQYRFHKNYENALNEIFIQEDYRWLVEGLKKDTVAIDIGAFCGESVLNDSYPIKLCEYLLGGVGA